MHRRRRGHRPGRRDHDPRHGHRRQVPFALATGLGLNAFVAFSVASTMSWPEAMGMVVIEGVGHRRPRAHRRSGGGVPGHPGPAEVRDRGRHRPVHRADRLRRRRLRPRRRRHPGAARRSTAPCTAGRPWSSWSGCCSSACSRPARSAAASSSASSRPPCFAWIIERAGPPRCLDRRRQAEPDRLAAERARHARRARRRLPGPAPVRQRVVPRLRRGRRRAGTCCWSSPWC